MVNTSSILNHADIDLRKTPDFIRVPVELKKEERQLNLKVNDVNEKEIYLFSTSVYFDIYHKKKHIMERKDQIIDIK